MTDRIAVRHHSRSTKWIASAIGIALAGAVTAPLAKATSAPVRDAPRILGTGDVEMGVAGSIVDDGGSTRVTLSVRGGSFVEWGAGLVGFEADVGYRRIRELDQLDVTGNAAWLFETGSGVYPFLAFTGGVRQEWLGSFRNALGVVGGMAGARVLFGSRVAGRVDYRGLRFLDDPAEDFTEHQVLFGISVLLGSEERNPTR